MKLTKENINNALNVLLELSIDYGNKNAAEIRELDNALDIVQMAAQKYANIYGDNYKDQATKRENEAYLRGYQDGRKLRTEYEKGWAEGCQAGYAAAKDEKTREGGKL